MINNYINIYNNLVNLTRNKSLYNRLVNPDTFSDRMIIFQIHFAFFLKIFKNEDNKKQMQDIYDYIFKQLELSIREIGYGDATINKKMKDYINVFYSVLTSIDNWEIIENKRKNNIFSNYFNSLENPDYFRIYFEKYRLFLINNSLNSFTKGVLKLNF